MYLDNRTLFSDAQAIVATAASTNTIDTLALGKAKTYAESQIKRRLGIADIPLFLKVTENFTLLTSFCLQSYDFYPVPQLFRNSPRCRGNK